MACETLFPPPEPPIDPPPGKEWFEQPLNAAGDVTGMTLTVAYDPKEATFRGFSGAPEGAIAAADDDGAGTVRIAWFSTSPTDGGLLRLHWAATEDAAAPTVEEATAYDATGSLADAGLSLGVLAASGAGAPVDRHDALGAVAGTDAAAAACAQASYPAELAAYPLGDLDASGTVDVHDVVAIYAAIAGDELASAEAHDLFHSDLTGDCAYDESDLRKAFMKAAFQDAEASLVVKPRRLSYQQLRQGVPVLIANGGNEPLAGLTADGVNLDGSSFTGDVDWLVEGQSATWTLSSDPNDALGALRVGAGGVEAEVAVGNVAILVAGQSNAVGWDPDVPPELEDGEAYPEVRMLGNDYVWRAATEPLDDPSGQVDAVSRDSTPGTSAGTRVGRLLHAGDEEAGIAGTGRPVYLIPAALGGSRMTPGGSAGAGVGWYLGAGDLAGTSRSTLFGSAAYRALVSSGLRDNPKLDEGAEGGPVSAVYWFQGESDNSNPTLRGDYTSYTEQVFQAFRQHLGEATSAVEPVIIYAQLAAYGCCEDGSEGPAEAAREDLRSHDIAERQRRLEAGVYRGTAQLIPNTGLSNGVAGAHMVVTHDLPRSDRIHLSAEAQMVLAERVALAYQEHVLGWDVDGTGPRLAGVSRSGRVVTLTFDRDVTQTASPGPNGYSGYFTAYWGPPSSGTDYSGYGGNEVGIDLVTRDPNDARRVHITLDGDYTNVYVRYKRPHEATWTSDYVEDVIRGADSGLPLPSFGPLRVN